MLKTITLILSLFIFFDATSWGSSGHRIVGEIAQQYLSKKSNKKIKNIFGDKSLAYNANWMDFIKSDTNYSYLTPLHYATIPDGMSYIQAGTPKGKDIIWAINDFIRQLKTDTLTLNEERLALRCLIHLVGDIHQPLHIGNGNDRGGNDFELSFFQKKSNLHKVWDSDIINSQNLSFTEWAVSIGDSNKEEVQRLQSSTPLDWAVESRTMHTSIYPINESKNLSYKYIFEHKKTLDRRLKEAGIRLAGLLNEIYK